MSWRGTIPIYINNFNRLTTTRALAAWFDDVPATEVIIIDNASTYQPLLEWYRSCQYKLIRLPDNCGHHAPWKQGCVLWHHTHQAMFGSEWYVVTDPDLSLDGIPKDMILQLMRGFDICPRMIKVGVSLEIDDLPEFSRDRVRDWEQKFWTNPIKSDDGRPPDYFRADIDTTLALYRSHTMHATAMTTNQGNLRAAKPYTARHMPWYLDPQNLSAEEVHYFQQANGCITWRPQ